MNIGKRLIINEIENFREEWVLKVIKKLLDRL